jgi:hypothetical protein
MMPSVDHFLREPIGTSKVASDVERGVAAYEKRSHGEQEISARCLGLLRRGVLDPDPCDPGHVSATPP